MKNYKFVPNVWITFTYGGRLYVGRTLEANGQEIVSCVAEDGTIGELMFQWVENPVKLNFGMTKQQELFKLINTEQDKGSLTEPSQKKFPVLLHLN